MAGVIKKEQFTSAAAFSFEDFGRRAEQILEHARAEARALREAVLREAETEIATLREQARAAGHAEGRAEGLRQAREEGRQAALREARSELSRLQSAMKDALREIEQRKHHLLAEAERGLIRLAVEIARRICKYAVAVSSDAAVANARRLLELVEHDHDVTLAVNPQEWETLQEAVGDLVEDCRRLNHVHVVADADVSLGGCRVRTASCEINADIDMQLQRLAAALLPGETPPEPQE
ncbi:MAG: hypothetical protein D6744_19075 [Planctomycetota bacterium]|nr:MAG: hypothetical protein D6744_19075 [Planctomycetota bacterium]